MEQVKFKIFSNDVHMSGPSLFLLAAVKNSSSPAITYKKVYPEY